MEIEVGEYVRTEKGIIDKVISFRGDLILFEKDSLCEYKSENDIAKHSKNIIDLIEVGDYVNGKKVISILDYEDFKKVCFDKDFDDVAYEEDIKSVVTKEQFVSVEYKVGG